MKALIVGGGVGGMSAAIVLRGLGHDVDLIDLDPQWRVYGAGITITGPTLRALHAIGLYDRIREVGYTGEGIRVCSALGEPIEDLPTPMPPGSPTAGSGGIMRPVLHGILSQATREAGVAVTLGVTVDHLEQDPDGVSARLSNGIEGRYDLVIGADGVFSGIRRLVFPDAPKPAYTGQCCWRLALPRPPQIDRRHYFLGGPVKVGLSPVSAKQMYMFMLQASAEPIWLPDEALAAALAELLDGYGGILAEIRDTLRPGAPIVLRPLEAMILPPPWRLGRVVLIGDAAHPTTPQLASGAGMAIEDAIVLGEELAAAEQVGVALEAFMARRYERCRTVVENSFLIGKLEQERAPIGEQTAVVQKTLKLLAEPI